ncbi:MAG: hypothetical protein LBT05_06510 [Planctomycetaceae bacterium]|jgi:hypothetical protein|nr:hypothetical protein [Planctomycetaceae bacterium]
MLAFTNIRKHFCRRNLVGGSLLMLAFLAVVPTTSAQQEEEKTKPISEQKAKLIGYVEDFFMHNFRDITMRKSLEWSDVVTDEEGRLTIRYKYEALIWDKTRITNCAEFTYDKDGRFIKQKRVEGFPQEIKTEKPANETVAPNNFPKEKKPETAFSAFRKQLLEKQTALAKQKYDAIAEQYLVSNPSAPIIVYAESRYEWMRTRIELTQFLRTLATEPAEISRLTNELGEYCQEAYFAVKVGINAIRDYYRAGFKGSIELAPLELRLTESQLKILDAYPYNNLDKFQKIDREDKPDFSYWRQTAEEKKTGDSRPEHFR